MSDYELNADDIQLNIWISTAASAASLILCSAVLAAAAWIWRTPALRLYIDRVSFRLLMWSMVFEVAYDVAYIAVEFYSTYNVSGGLCSTGVYFMMAFVGVVNYLCTAIAVNLALTISFGMNPIKQRLERWYVGISIVVGMFVPIIPAGLGHFGFDPILQVCWITGKTDEQRYRYFILDLYLWQILSCLIATVSVIVTLTTLIRQRRATSAALYAGNKLNRTLLSSTGNEDEYLSQTVAGSAGDKEAQANSQNKKYLWARLSPAFASRRSSRMSHTMSQLEDRFLKIALKISVYPVALIVVNVIITVGDLAISSAGGVNTKGMYALYCIYYFLYGGRGLVFGLLALFIDPCLRIGLKAAWRLRFHPDRPMPGMDLETTNYDSTEKSFSEMLAMPDPVAHLSYESKKERSRISSKGQRESDSGPHDEKEREASASPSPQERNRPPRLDLGKLNMSDRKHLDRQLGGYGDVAGDGSVAELNFDTPGWADADVNKLDLAVAALKEGIVSPVEEYTISESGVGSKTSSGRATPTPTQRQKRLSSTSLDMPAALSGLAYDVEQDAQDGSRAMRAATAPTSPNPSDPLNARIESPRPQRTSFHLPARPLSPRSFSPRSILSPRGRSNTAGPSSPNARSPVAASIATYRTESASPSKSPNHTPSRSFVGVDVEDLPADLTDDVDVQLPSSPLAPLTSPPRRSIATSRGRPSLPNIDNLAIARPDSTEETRDQHGATIHTPMVASPFNGSCISLPRRRPSREPSIVLDPLDPDLPSRAEEALRQRRARRERKRVEKEEAIMAFLQTKAML